MRIVIVGAGIGGLSAGIALKKYGHQVTVYEQVQKILPVGAAISVWSNGVKCLNYLGLAEQTKALGGIMDHLAYIDGLSEQTLTQFSLAPLIEQVGQRPYPVSRAELQHMLMEEFGLEDIQLGVRLTGIQDHDDYIDAQLSTGETVQADLLIGADGTHSLARDYVLGQKVERRYAGYVNWNGLIEIDETIAPADQWTTFVGEGKRVSLMPIAGQRFYFFFDVPLAVGLGNDKAEYKSRLKEYFAGWCEPVQKLIDILNPQTTNRVEIHDIDPFYTWYKGRCVLLGDAAHSTTPDIGQGGCMALEDAVYLVRALTVNTHSLEDALARYQQVRSARANDFVLRARKRCDITHMKDEEVTQNWYQELKEEDGSRIIKGIISNIEGSPLD